MIMNMKRITRAAIAVAAIAFTSLADLKELPVKNIDGRSYHYYEVQPKETVYSICRRLGISKEQLVEANPSVGTEGLKAYSELLFPVADEKPIADTHLVKKGETIYGICHKYGITPANLEAWNPNIRDGLRSGMTVYVSNPGRTDSVKPGDVVTSVAQQAPETVKRPDFEYYTVKDKETFYSIAHSHGISVAQLEEANPEVGLLKSGQILKIPVEIPDTAGKDVAENVAAIEISVPGADKQNDPDQTAVEQNNRIEIAIILPFMAETSPQPRQGQLYTEFYKGFLLGVDSMRSCGNPIALQVYDTNGSMDTLRSILEKPELKKAQVIIPPDNESQITEIARYGNANGISVLNLFSIKDRSYTMYPNVYQANIPHEAMYAKAIDGIINDMNGRIPVLIVPEEGQTDKQEFVNALKKRMDGAAIDYKTITYTTALGMDDLKDLDRTQSYAFIPASGKQSDLNRMLPALIELKGELTGYDPAKLYGYPEWTTFRGETLENMHTMNTYVYSRFFTVPEDPWASEVDDSFERWYGVPMGSYVPRQGLLGFDTAMYLIGALGGEHKETYRGVQNGYHFIRPAGVSGYVNNDLYFVNFRPSGLIDRIAL